MIFITTDRFIHPTEVAEIQKQYKAGELCVLHSGNWNVVEVNAAKSYEEAIQYLGKEAFDAVQNKTKPPSMDVDKAIAFLYNKEVSQVWKDSEKVFRELMKNAK